MINRALIFVFFAILFAWPSAQAQVAQSEVSVPVGGEFCALFGSKGAAPQTLLQSDTVFDCSKQRLAGQGDYLWLRADLSAAARGIDIPIIRATMSRHGGIQTYATYADGSSAHNVYPVGKLRDQWRSSDGMAFPLSSESGAALEMLIIGVDDPWDTENWGGLDLMSADADLRQHINGMAHSSLFSGLLLGPVLVSLLFFAVLRARFIAVHFAMIFAAFLYGASWSGMLFSLLPWLEVPARSDFNHIVIPIAFLFGCLFARELCEKDKLPNFWRNSLVIVGVLPLIIALTAMTFGTGMPQLSFGAMSASLIAPPIVVCISLIIASLNGSLMARLQLLGWSGVCLVILGNLAHDLGVLEDHTIFNHGLFPALLLEALMTSALVTYRVIKLRRQMDITAGERIHLEKAARTDFLTKLPNRSHFIRHFEQTIGAGAHRTEPMALICLDIDNFKRINDAHGHAIGDKTLIEIGKLLNATTASEGLAARFGGEEFSILTAAASKEDLYYRAERLRHVISEHAFEHVEKVTISIGIVHICPDTTVSFDAYYDAADAALYAAKAAGRNQVRLSGWKPDAVCDDAEDAAYAQEWKLTAT